MSLPADLPAVVALPARVPAHTAKHGGSYTHQEIIKFPISCFVKYKDVLSIKGDKNIIAKLSFFLVQ